MMSTKYIPLAPGKMPLLVQQGSARSTRSGGSRRPSSCNPTLITSFFRPKVTTDPIKSVIPSTRHRGGSEAPTDIDNSNGNTNLLYNSFYPNIDHFKYNLCRNSRCKTCPAADPDQICKNNTYLTFCKVFNCVYMLSCKICKCKYIGQTSSHINIRMNLHRSMTKSNSSNNITPEIEHFKLHGFDNIYIRIIDIVPELKNRLWWENKHIDQFQTVFPYGLNTILFNHHINPDYISASNNPSVFKLNNKNKYNQIKNSKMRGKGKDKNTLIKSIKKLDIFLQMECENNNIPINWIKHLVFNIKVKLLSQFWNYCYKLFQTKYKCEKNSKKIVLLQVMDILKHRIQIHGIDFRVYGEYKLKYCVVNFTNKTFNHLRCNRIFKNHQSVFPVKNLKIITAFKYNTPVSRRIYNYNDISKKLFYSKDQPCECMEESEFFNKDHGHIITGNTKIVNNINLRELMNLGTGFRISNNYNYKVTLNIFTENIDTFIYNNAVYYSLPINAFNEWKYNIIKDFELIYGQHPVVKQCIKINKVNAIAEIKNLQKSFVISYIDKVTSNYAFTCRFYYCAKLKEVYSDTTLYSKTLINQEIIQKRLIALYKKVGIIIKNIKFPYLVLIPKLHKTPVKFRSVTVGCGSYLEIANKKLLKIISNIYYHMNQLGGIIIRNSYEAIKILNNLPIISYFKSFDFADLFNSINLGDLKEIMLQAYEKYDLQQFCGYNIYKTLIQIVLMETYISDGGNLYVQNTGIPMGGACSSALADIYLFTYESGTIFNNELTFFRYVDDILICFHTEKIDIKFDFYPTNLTLVETPQNEDGSINFLDVNLKCVDYKVMYKIYNKRDEYNFKINHITNWNSNLHINVFRNLLINFFHRCTKLNNNIFFMNLSIIHFLNHAKTNNFPVNFILTMTSRYFGLERSEVKSRFRI